MLIKRQTCTLKTENYKNYLPDPGEILADDTIVACIEKPTMKLNIIIYILKVIVAVVIVVVVLVIYLMSYSRRYVLAIVSSDQGEGVSTHRVVRATAAIFYT